MNLNELTVGQLRQLAELLKPFVHGPTVDPNGTPLPAHPYIIGKKYLFRCVTHYQLGIVTAVYPQEIVLDNDAMWVADTGRFRNATRTGTLPESECEVFTRAPIVNRGAIVDVVEWGGK